MKTMTYFPPPKINLRKLPEKEWNDFRKWKNYSLLFNRVTKDDRDYNLDSNVFLDLSVSIRPKYDKKMTAFSDLIDLLLSIRKETTFSYSELPDRFLGHYFDEVTIFPTGSIASEIPVEYGNLYMAGWKRNFVVVDEMDIDINLANDPREGKKGEILLPNAFDLEDTRFRHILDCFQIYNELSPAYSFSRGNAIFFYKRLNYLKNELFDIANPDDVSEYTAIDIRNGRPYETQEVRHRYWIPPKDLSIKKSAHQKSDKIISVFNENWNMLGDLEKTYESLGYGFRDNTSAATGYLREIQKTYGHFLRTHEIASFCLNCDFYFPFRKGKLFCSLSTDGRNCGKSYRNKKDYMRHWENRKKRSQAYMRTYRKLLLEKGVRK